MIPAGKTSRRLDNAITATEIDNLPFEILWQMLHKEARADIKPGAGEDIRMVVDSPVSTFQLPANGLRRIGQLRFIESAINQARFFPCQRGGGWAEHFFEQFQRGSVNVTGLGTGNNTCTFNGKGGPNASNTFSGTLTVTVDQVLVNGNLHVVGEKQIAINQGTEFIRFSGVVNPRTISGSNTVPSTQVADARIEYVGNGYINEAQNMGWLQRFFLNLSPM